MFAAFNYDASLQGFMIAERQAREYTEYLPMSLQYTSRELFSTTMHNYLAESHQPTEILHFRYYNSLLDC